jgi:hypothetical protein
MTENDKPFEQLSSEQVPQPVEVQQPPRRLFILKVAAILAGVASLALGARSEAQAQGWRRERRRRRRRPGGDPGWGHQDSSSGGGADRTRRRVR